jgi:hypothetical protein
MSRMIAKKRYVTLLMLLVLGGCASFGTISLLQLYGESAPRDRVVEEIAPNQIDYWSDVKPVLESRCVVCHACYDAPCQLKLSSIEGIERGASKEVVYDQARLFAAVPNRLFVDAQTTEAWRQRNFHPVLNEHDQTLVANREAGLIYQLLKLKDSHLFPENQKLGKEFEFELDRKMTCPTPDEADQFAKEHPAWGMPYAFPALSSVENDKLTRWLEQGATYSARPALEKPYLEKVAEWEAFLNGDSNKQRLMSRYIYEHLFLGHLFFDEFGHSKGRPSHFFELVRSSTPPGQSIKIIATRKPYDDPGVERVYYRISEIKSTIVAKTHMPYALNPRRLAFWRDLFIDKPYDVPAMPGYLKEVASNPFVAFQYLPVSSRYKFMLDEAQYSVMGFIKGPVCRGQVALNVIRDNFWVVFVAPNELLDSKMAEFYRANSDLLALPEEADSSSTHLLTWRTYSKKYSQLNEKSDAFLDANLGSEVPYNLDLVWDGDGVNQNAALTVFRHFDSATVEKGFVGNPPKTAWLLGYADLERIHYLLVAGYDVYGNVGHQLFARLYMDFLRMSSEGAFLLLMPQDQRVQERADWYKGADPELLKFISSPVFESEHEPDIDYQTKNVKLELYEKIRQRLGNAMSEDRQIVSTSDDSVENALLSINKLQGEQLSYLPELSMLIVEGDSDSEVFTLVRNNAHSNMTSMFREKKNRILAEDTMMILRGFVGSYPAALFKVKKDDIRRFSDLIGAVNSEASFQVLADQFGVRRTRTDFWSISDELNALYKQAEPINSGVLDYNRFGNY